ncbi:MAG TPA: histidinol phosphatase [Agriterribacter sp.]|nr:histidinol phosphatase [Agriterribacter sp.]HRQ49629.1 histidinol phosphatase [Agriterribacter sp.]
MFSLFKKRPPAFDGNLSVLKCDMHSHLIPGIDDGSPDMETSVQLIEGLRDAGYEKLITTPHLMFDLYPNNRQIITRGYEKLKDELEKRKINMELKAAAEYFLDDHFDSLLQKDEPLLTIKENLVLVEFSFASAPLDYKEKLFNLQMKGYKPILAHPERYTYFHQKPGIYGELRDSGCLFQVNILSLSGYYGRSVAQMAARLFKLGYIELLGTDLHHHRHLQHLQSPEVYQKVNEIAATLPLLNNRL